MNSLPSNQGQRQWLSSMLEPVCTIRGFCHFAVYPGREKLQHRCGCTTMQGQPYGALGGQRVGTILTYSFHHAHTRVCPASTRKKNFFFLQKHLFANLKRLYSELSEARNHFERTLERKQRSIARFLTTLLKSISFLQFCPQAPPQLFSCILPYSAKFLRDKIFAEIKF